MADLVSCNDLGQPWHILSRFWLMGRTHFQGLFGHYPLIWPQANPLSPPVVKKLPFSTAKKFLLSFFLGRALKAVEGGKSCDLLTLHLRARANIQLLQTPINHHSTFKILNCICHTLKCILLNFEMYFSTKKLCWFYICAREQKINFCKRRSITFIRRCLHHHRHIQPIPQNHHQQQQQ